MSENYDNRAFETQQTILAALCVILALVGSCWGLAYRAYTTTPTTETITVQLPPGMVASKTVLVASPEQQAGNASAQTVQIEQEKPERKWFSGLLHPFGFGVLLLVIIGTGGVAILWASLRRGGSYG